MTLQLVSSSSGNLPEINCRMATSKLTAENDVAGQQHEIKKSINGKVNICRLVVCD